MMLCRNSVVAFLFSLCFLAAAASTSLGCGDSGSGLGDNDNDNDAGTNTSDASTIPDSGPDLDCNIPGDIRFVECGNCGQASQECGQDLIWGQPGDCFGEGECPAGQYDEQPCEFCGTRSRLCDEQCTWFPWETGDCSGVCAAGTADATSGNCELGQRQHIICNTDCAWENDGGCTGACVGTPRTGTPDFKDEICVDGGLAFMGADEGEGTILERPEHIVALSPFFIDVYEVTVARYRECVQAGACTVPDTYGYSTYYEPNHDDYPVNNVTWVQASELCAWDGGRVLPTEAQWEKAARGPYPDDVRNPWGNTPATCELVTAGDCPLGSPTYLLEPVNSHPLGASIYGVMGMAGNVCEWVADYLGDYSVTTEPILDPVGSSNPSNRCLRGFDYEYWRVEITDSVTKRWVMPDSDQRYTGFRCARSDQ